MEYGPAGEYLGQAQAGLGDVLLLIGRANEFGRGRERLGAKVNAQDERE